MQVKKFKVNKDDDRVIEFLRDYYNENKNISSCLPQRFDDLIFRVDTLYKNERGLKAFQDYTYIFENNNKIVRLVVLNCDSFNSCIKTGYEKIFNDMLDIVERELNHYLIKMKMEQ